MEKRECVAAATAKFIADVAGAGSFAEAEWKTVEAAQVDWVVEGEDVECVGEFVEETGATAAESGVA